jgi:hypothetical protein
LSKWSGSGAHERADLVKPGTPYESADVRSGIFSSSLPRRFPWKESRFSDSRIIASLKQAEAGEGFS